MADRNETFPEVLAALMRHHNVTGTDIARAVGGHPSTISTWLNGRKTPRAESLRVLAEAYPAFSLKRLTEAAGRTVALPISADRRARLLDLFDRLTEAQQDMLEVQIRGLVAHNRKTL